MTFAKYHITCYNINMEKNIRKKKNRIKPIALLISLAMITLSLSGCTSYNNFKDAFFAEENSDTVKIAIYEPLSGKYEEEGNLEVRGFEVAKSIKPEVLGKEIEFIYVDTNSNLDIAKAEVENLIPQVPAAVLGSYGSTYSLLGGEYFENAQIPAISITNSNPYVTKSNPYYFRMATVETRQGEALADFIYNGLKLDKVAVINTVGDDVANAVNTIMESELDTYSKGEMAVSHYEIQVSDISYDTYFKKIEAEGIETIFLPTSEETAEKIIREAEIQNYEFEFIGTATLDTDEFRKSIEGLDATVYMPDMTPTANESTPLYDQFKEEYEKEYPGEEIAPETALAFDGYMLLLDSIERAGGYDDGQLLAETILSTKEYEGLTGIFTFDSEGDPISDITIVKIRGGSESKVFESKAISGDTSKSETEISQQDETEESTEGETEESTENESEEVTEDETE